MTYTEEVISKGNELMVELLNMETGERGFLLTGKPQFLEPYEKALKTFNKRLDTGLELVFDNPTQVKNLKKIEILAEKWLKEAGKKEIGLRKDAAEGTAHFEDLQALLSHGEEKDILDNIRVVIKKIESSFNDINNEHGAFLALSIVKDMVDQETG